MNEPPSPPAKDVLEWNNAADGIKMLRKEYHYWTERLTAVSFQLWLSLIAANWAVFGSVDHIINNLWSKGSIFFVTLGVVVDVVGAWQLGELHRAEIDEANAHPDTWKKRFDKGWGNPDERWPFTKGIEDTAKVFRYMKLTAMVVAWVLFFVALLCP